MSQINNTRFMDKIAQHDIWKLCEASVGHRTGCVRHQKV